MSNWTKALIGCLTGVCIPLLNIIFQLGLGFGWCIAIAWALDVVIIELFS